MSTTTIEQQSPKYQPTSPEHLTLSPRADVDGDEDSSVPTDATDVTERTRRPERKVSTDPRTVSFTIGHHHQNLKGLGTDIKGKFGESIYIKFIHPRSDEFGFWKILSRSDEAIDEAVKWLREKEAECVAAILDGSYNPLGRRRDGGNDRGPPRGRDGRDDRGNRGPPRGRDDRGDRGPPR